MLWVRQATGFWVWVLRYFILCIREECSQRSEEGVEPHGTGVTDRYKLSGVGEGLNLGLVEEQVLLTIDP